jgi:hypothetical protein
LKPRFDEDFRDAFLDVNVAILFNNDYTASRDLLLEKLQHLNIINSERLCWPLAAKLVNVTPLNLSTDVIWIGDADAKKVLVLISGTHGVEGFCGSAIQSFILQALQASWLVLPPNTALLLIHALNPWGMHWARRCDHEGIDINRNFVDFQQRPEPNPRYRELLAYLLEADPSTRRQKTNALAQQWGQRDFEQVFSGGQYENSWAPFYGGQRPALASQVIDEVIAKWQLETRDLTVIDIHTGLGPWAYGELISDHAAGDRGNDAATALFGENVALTNLGLSCSVPKLGLLDYRWHRLMTHYGCFLTLEFGTFGTDALFDVLMGEHLFWYKNSTANADCRDYQKQRQAMLTHFCPQDKLWQQATLFRSWQLVQQYLAGR